MEEKKLYPLEFIPLKDEYVWGSEEFLLADLGYRDSLVRHGWLAANSISEIMDMYTDRVCGENPFEFWGRQFPLCLKRLKVNGRMPLRVHPDDVTAARRWDFLGKEKLWYIVSAAPGARVALGFGRDCDGAEVYAGCLDGSVESLLNFVTPYPGQMIHIAPGVSHAAFGEMEILEVCESSPLDFCLCTWGEQKSDVEFDPALTLEDALDFIDYSRHDASFRGSGLFEAEIIRLSSPLRVKAGIPESFALYCCLGREAALQYEDEGKERSAKIGKGAVVLVPADCPEYLLVPAEADTLLLEVTVPYRKEEDPYVKGPSL